MLQRKCDPFLLVTAVNMPKMSDTQEPKRRLMGNVVFLVEA